MAPGGWEGLTKFVAKAFLGTMGCKQKFSESFLLIHFKTSNWQPCFLRCHFDLNSEVAIVTVLSLVFILFSSQFLLNFFCMCGKFHTLNYKILAFTFCIYPFFLKYREYHLYHVILFYLLVQGTLFFIISILSHRSKSANEFFF